MAPKLLSARVCVRGPTGQNWNRRIYFETFTCQNNTFGTFLRPTDCLTFVHMYLVVVMPKELSWRVCCVGFFVADAACNAPALNPPAAATTV